MRTEIPIVVLNPVSPYNPVSGASVYLTNRQTGSPATVYTTESGGSQITNTGNLTTDSSGRVTGWIDRAAYQAVITIPGGSPYTEYFESVPGSDGSLDATWYADGSISTSKLADSSITSLKIADGTIITGDISDDAVTAAKLADHASVDASRAVTTNHIRDGAVTAAKLASGAVTAPALASNVVPLGTVIDWWRPTTATAVPSGWAICDGTAWSSITNDFGLNSGNIPNLVNKVTVGARIYVANSADTSNPADGLASSNGDAWTNAPGIGGTGGSNAALNLQHSHTVTIPAHFHGHTLSASTSIGAAGNHSHTSDAYEPNLLKAGSTGSGTFTAWSDTFYGGGIKWQIYIIPNVSYSGDHTHSATTTISGSVGNTGGSNGNSSFNASSVSNSLSATTDARPGHVGMLKIMKVRNV